MDFVDDIDLVLTLTRRKGDLVTQVAHIIDAGIRRGVDLDQVEKTALINAYTGRALVAGASFRVLVGAVVRLGQQSGGRRLAGAARPAEKIGVTDAPALQGITQRARDMFLPDHFIEQRWSPLELERLFRHGATPPNRESSTSVRPQQPQ